MMGISNGNNENQTAEPKQFSQQIMTAKNTSAKRSKESNQKGQSFPWTESEPEPETEPREEEPQPSYVVSVRREPSTESPGITRNEQGKNKNE